MNKISVIIQGPIIWDLTKPKGLPTTFYSIEQARKIIPNCEIILSTWEGEKTDLLNYDKIIKSTDPGPQGKSKQNSIPNNVNRQITSTVAGLKAATYEFSLKIRSDTILTSNRFIEKFNRTPPPDAKWALFKQKIISNNLSSRNPRALPNTPLCFHPADHAHYGNTIDLLTLWDIPLQTEFDANFYIENPHPDGFRINETSRLTPEQHICTSAFKKKFEINISHYSDKCPDLLEQSEKLLLNNFLFLKDKDFSVRIDKYHTIEHQKYE